MQKYDFEKSLIYLNLSYKIANENSYTDIIIRNLILKGILYQQHLNFNLSLKYLNEGLKLSEKFNFQSNINVIEGSILEVNNIINGIDNKKDSIPDKNSIDKEEIIRYKIYNANQLKEQKNYNEVKENLKEALTIADEINLKGSQAEVYIAFYDFYRTTKDTQKAQNYYNKANQIIQNAGHKLFEKRLEDIRISHDQKNPV